MLVLTALSAVFFLLVDPLQATYVHVNYTLSCKSLYRYRYKVVLREIDVIWDDYLAENSGEVIGTHIGDIGGWDWDDPPTPSFEFAVTVEHNCGGGDMKKKEVELESCATTEYSCEYDMIWFDL